MTNFLTLDLLSLTILDILAQIEDRDLASQVAQFESPSDLQGDMWSPSEESLLLEAALAALAVAPAPAPLHPDAGRYGGGR
jgi:hypothetical protein